MNHAEFHRAVGKIAAGRYFATKVEASSHSHGQTKVDWMAYIDDRGWTREHGNPGDVLAELAGVAPDTGIDGIGAAPVTGETGVSTPTVTPDNVPAEF